MSQIVVFKSVKFELSEAPNNRLVPLGHEAEAQGPLKCASTASVDYHRFPMWRRYFLEWRVMEGLDKMTVGVGLGTIWHDVSLLGSFW